MISRYEYKYLLTRELADQVRQRAMIWMDPDEMGDADGYLVTSLYCDRSDWMLARQTWEGARERFKLRIRFYGPTPETVFAEVKKRVGSTINKVRERIPAEYAHALATNQPLPDGVNCPQYRELSELIDAVPGLWVRYKREAFVSNWGDGARLTLDRGLEVQEPVDRVFFPSSSWRTVELTQPVILEMKFNGAYPLWMMRIAEALELRRVSCSKYAQGVDTLIDQPWLANRRDPNWRRG